MKIKDIAVVDFRNSVGIVMSESHDEEFQLRDAGEDIGMIYNVLPPLFTLE